MYNWKISITTRNRFWERSMNLGDLILEMFGKRSAEWTIWFMSGERNRSLSMESPTYTVPELTRIVRVVENHIPITIRFSFFHESIAEMALFIIPRLVKLCAWFPHMRSKYRRRTLVLILSGDIHGAVCLILVDFDLTGVCLSNKVLIWYIDRVVHLSLCNISVFSEPNIYIWLITLWCPKRYKINDIPIDVILNVLLFLFVSILLIFGTLLRSSFLLSIVSYMYDITSSR